MQTSEVLNRAADLIEERGWERGTGWVLSNRPADTPVCLEGAIQAAAGITIRVSKGGLFNNGDMRELHTCPAYLAVAAHINRVRNLFVWNDTRNSASEVIEVLRACAVIEASRERQPVEVAS